MSSFSDNLDERLHNNGFKYCKYCREYVKAKEESLICNSLESNKNHKICFKEDLVKRFSNKNKFCGGDIDNVYLMLRKGVYLYKCMDSYKRFNEPSLPDKKKNYNNLNIENITDADYKHVWRDFALKNLGDYHDLYVQSDKLILLIYFKTFESNVRKHINLSHPAPFFISTRISIDKQF